MVSIRQRVSNGEYDPGAPPSMPSRPIPVFSQGNDHPGSADYRAYADALEKHEKDLIGYQDQLERYNIAQQALLDRFAHDLANEHGMLGHPKQEMLYAMALKHAHYHTKGLYAVITWYEEFLPLAR